MTILLLEDNRKAADDLARLIREWKPDVRIEGPLASLEATARWFATHPLPDLIFADIELSDGLSLTFFREQLPPVPIIFCTAYDRYALEAFESAGVDYLLKPVDPEKLTRSFGKIGLLHAIFAREEFEEKISRVIRQLTSPYRRTLVVHRRGRLIPLNVEEIRFAYTENDIVYLHTRDRRYEADSSMENLEADLDPHQFFRANRQFLIARDAIAEVHRGFARKLTVTLHIPTPVSVVISKAKASAFLKWMED